MTANVLDAVGRQYENAHPYFSDPDIPVLGGVYLIGRDYDAPKVIIAEERYEGNDNLLMYQGRAYRAGMLNDPRTKVGDYVIPLEKIGNLGRMRRDQRAEVIEMTDEGPRVRQGRNNPTEYVVKFWAMHSDNGARRVADRHDPNRRQIVLDKITREGMDRIGDTGYATSAREFFDEFNLPHPPVRPTASIDTETSVKWNEMSYEMRREFERRGITSLREAVFKGRTKIVLPKSECRCKDVTFDEVKAAATRNGQTVTEGTLHKVQCMWCVPVSNIDEAVPN